MEGIMGLLSPFAHERSGKPVFDNTKRLARLRYRFKYYQKVALSARGRIPVTTMLRSHFSFLLPENPRPAHLTLEFTNFCNLKCPYCTSPLGIRTQGMMSAETFDLLVRQIKEFGVRRVRVVGNGESTLHPRFGEMIRELAGVCPYLTMVSNGQRWTEKTMRAILEAPVRLLEISADSDEKIGYENARIGGKFERLLTNLIRLKELKQELGAPTLVNIRAMIRPTLLARETEILAFWSAYGDSVIPQYVHDYTKGAFSDVFQHQQDGGLIPHCSIPSKAMIVHWNGKVPLCEFSQRQTGMPDGLIVGDVHTTTLREIWNSPLFLQYRAGHRKRDESLTPICRGCIGG
jgi:MoaA/NifB/PqqE/SkfB family radical SAM enzyme